MPTCKLALRRGYCSTTVRYIVEATELGRPKVTNAHRMPRIFSLVHGKFSKLPRGGEGLTFPKCSVANTLVKDKKHDNSTYRPFGSHTVTHTILVSPVHAFVLRHENAHKRRRHVLDIHVTMTSSRCCSFPDAEYFRCASTPMDIQGFL